MLTYLGIFISSPSKMSKLIVVFFCLLIALISRLYACIVDCPEGGESTTEDCLKEGCRCPVEGKCQFGPDGCMTSYCSAYCACKGGGPTPPPPPPPTPPTPPVSFTYINKE